MKRMCCFFLVLVAAVAVCDWLVCRSQRSVPKEARPMDRMQENVRLEHGQAYTADEAAKRRLREKLREEERRQRPGEGRN